MFYQEGYEGLTQPWVANSGWCHKQVWEGKVQHASKASYSITKYCYDQENDVLKMKPNF